MYLVNRRLRLVFQPRQRLVQRLLQRPGVRGRYHLAVQLEADIDDILGDFVLLLFRVFFPQHGASPVLK